MLSGVKYCITCKKAIRGRADKKYCDDYCRNNYNNQLKSAGNNYVRNVNNALGKNRRILTSFLGGAEVIKVARDKMLKAGFQFKFITNTYTNKKGNTYFFCYETGYLALENEWYLVVKQRED